MKSSIFSPRSLARTSAHHPWRTLLVWLVAIVAIVGLGNTVGADTDSENGDTGDFIAKPESMVGFDLIDEHFGEDNRASEILVLTSDTVTVDDPGFRAVVDETVVNLAPWQGDIVNLTNYYELPTESPEATALVSEDRRSLLIPIQLAGEPADYTDRGEAWLNESQAAATGTINVYAVGDVSGNETFNAIAEEDLGKETSIGLPVAGVVLVVVFGALIAAVLPLVIGVVAIMLASGAVMLFAHVIPVSETTTIVTTMIGLAVGIDYALFFLERFREERRHGALKVDAVERAGATAGKAVLFSGGTVILALGGLMFLPIRSFQSISIAVATVVVVAVIAALTLLPALLRLVGDWINFPRIGIMRKLRRQDQTGHRQFEEHRGQGMWGRVARLVMRRPGVAFVLTTAVLLAFTAPILTMKLGQAGTATLPETDFRSGFMVMAEKFDAGLDDPMYIVVEGAAADPATQAGVEALIDTLSADERFGDVVAEPSPDNAITRITAVTHADPYSEDGKDVVSYVRDTAAPRAFGETENVYVSGSAAANVDFNDTLSDNLPRVFGFVFALSFVLLMLAFRSIVVPAVSIVLNSLSVGAAYGMVVAVFQHGWGADLFGFVQVEAIASWIPVMLFSILFGLSMDYHVFLLSRVREQFDATGDNEESIRFGVQSTGRIITGAALIMVAVFGTFAAGRMAEIQQIGFGLGFAILIDATLIRTILVPAAMKLLGNANWYMPRPLRWLPDLRVEGDIEPVRLERRPSPTAAD